MDPLASNLGQVDPMYIEGSIELPKLKIYAHILLCILHRESSNLFFLLHFTYFLNPNGPGYTTK
jgi:hypothetical protein